MNLFKPETLQKPRILCLHGGGVSAKIFRLQARQLIQALAPYFRLVFVDGPFPSDMHPDLIPVYKKMGPCYSWADLSLQCTLSNGSPDFNTIIEKIRGSLRCAMEADPGTGDWVGLLGFSQGARLAISILLEDEIRANEFNYNALDSGFLGVKWHFGVLLAGRGPPYALSQRTMNCGQFGRPGPMNQMKDSIEFPAFDSLFDLLGPSPILSTPTLHVHGMQDPGLPFHQLLQSRYVAPGSSSVIEWDGEHRVPIRTADVDAVRSGILQIAKVSDASESVDDHLTDSVIRVPEPYR
ncbi:hypothetical protein N7540_008193 [Penicillium herquei]|nr:hypothetical protein N7540_008193 [Penicillium herquei]